jgi:hypothetical protein
VGVTSQVSSRSSLYLSAGLRRTESPAAPSEARTLSDLVARAELRREISDSAAVAFNYSRSRNLSAFEGNPSYRSDFSEIAGNFPLPWEVSAAATLSLRRNDYPLQASSIDEPRRDWIWGWAVGLGRTLGSRASGRAEYRRQHRSSNVAGLSSTAHEIVIQLDIDPLRKDSGQ